MAKDYQEKRRLFLERVQRIYPTISEVELMGAPLLAIRVNTLKSQQRLDNPIPWAPHCYWPTTSRAELTHSEAFTSGAIYLQNAASFIPPLVLDPLPGETILDMCAAPGGKASHIAALTDNKAELWVNDNSPPRIARMRANFARLAVQPHAVTLTQATRLDKVLPLEYFDKILLDAPCSGEGMINSNSTKDFTYWSVAHIKRLASLQKQLTNTAWKLLKPGGRLVYSTCTIAPEENEFIIDYLLRRHTDAQLEPISITPDNSWPVVDTWNNKPLSHDISACLRLRPSPSIEAFFVASFKKLIAE